MAKQLNVNLAFTADTSQARAELQNLQSQLSSILNSTNGKSFGNQITGDVQQAAKSIAELKIHLQNATNVKTGNLDFTKLSDSVRQSGMSLDQYATKLKSLGPAGQQAFNALASSIAQSEVPIKRSNALLTEMWTSLKNTARWQISSSILHGFMGSIQSAVGYAKDLNSSLNDIRIVTGASVDEMARFAEQANRSAKALSTTTTEYTKASLIYFQQGLDAQQVKERADLTIKMANVSRQSAEIVSDQLTAVWNNFAKGSENLEHFADVMVRLGADTASSSDEIAQGLEKFAAIGDMVGLSFDNAAAALATVTATTRQSAEVVGTAFKTIFARIQGLKLGETLDDGTTLNKYSEALEAVGISIKEQNGELKDMDNILAEMGAKWQSLSKDQQAALAQTVAGVRQYNQLVALMENFDFYEKNIQSAKSANGSLQEQANIYEESWRAASDRVRASLEKIYSSLLDDKAFIGALNTIEKMVTGIGNLIDGLGGLKGVLATVSTLLMRTFSNSIAQSLTSMVNSFKMLTPSGRQAYQDEKKAVLSKMNAQLGNAEYTSNEDQMRQKYMSQNIGLQEKFIENESKMSTLELEVNKALMDRNKILGENAIQTAKNKDLALQQRANAKEQLQLDVAKNSNATGSDYGQANARLKEWSASLTAVIKKQEGLKAAIKIVGDEGLNTDQKLEKITAELQEAGMEVDEIEKIITELKEAGMEADVLRQKLGQLQNSEDNIKTNMAFGELNDDTRREYRHRARNNSQELPTGMTKEHIEDYADGVRRTIIAENEGKMANEAYGKSYEFLDQHLEQSTLKQMAWADKLVASASIAMSVMSTLQSVSGIIDTWNDPDMSKWDKFVSIGSSLAMVLVMLAPLLQTTNLELIGLASNSIRSALGMGTFNAASAASAVSAGAAATGVGAFASALWSLIWPIGVVVAAIAGIVFIFNKLKQAAEAASIDGQIKKAEEEAKRLSDSLQETQEKADELRSSFEKYNSVVSELSKCTKGTDEWNEALQNVNSEVINLLEKYPQLASYTDKFGKTGIYRDEKTGALTVNENFFKEMEEGYAQGIKNIQASQVINEQKIAGLQNTKNFEELSDTLFTLFADNRFGGQANTQKLLDAYMGKGSETITQVAEKLFLQARMLPGTNLDENASKDELIKTLVNQGVFSSVEEAEKTLAEQVKNFNKTLADSSNGLSSALAQAARSSMQFATTMENNDKIIGNFILGDNQKVQDSKYAEKIVEATGNQFIKTQADIVQNLTDQNWGKEGASNNGQIDAKEKQYFEEYLKASGKAIEDYVLMSYANGEYKYKQKGAEDNTAISIDTASMIDMVATNDANNKAVAFAENLAFLTNTFDTNIQALESTKEEIIQTAAQLDINTHKAEIDNLQNKLIQVEEDIAAAKIQQDFLLDQTLDNSSLKDINSLDLTTDSDIAAHLGQMYGLDGVIDDATATQLGFDSAQSMIESFKEALDAADLSNFSQTIQDIVNKGIDLSTQVAKTYDEMINGSFGTTDGSKEQIGQFVPTGDQQERKRFDSAVQAGLSKDSKEANEELTKMVELLEKAPKGFKNLSKAADKIEAGSVKDFNKELQKVIDIFEDYESLDLTDIADGIISEDEAKDLGLNTKAWQKYLDMLKNTDEGAGKTKEELAELAEASLKTAKAFGDLGEGWATYKQNLQSGDLAKQADAISRIGEAFQGVFGFDLSELDISNTFLANPENIKLVEDAINGVDGALETLQSNLFNEIIVDVVGEEQLDLLMQDIAIKHAEFEGMSFEAAFTADPTGFLQALAESEQAANISAAGIQTAVSAMGYSMTYETETSAVTNTAETDGGYDWVVEQGPPMYYSYATNTDTDDPGIGQIKIPTQSLRKVPRDPVEVSTTALGGGTATNYQFGDGTSTNNNVTMADVKNIKIEKKTDTPTTDSIKSVKPLLNSATPPKTETPKKTGGGDKSSKKQKTFKPTERIKSDEDTTPFEREREVIDGLKEDLEEVRELKEDAWGTELLELIDLEEIKIKEVGEQEVDLANKLSQKIIERKNSLQATANNMELGIEVEIDEKFRISNKEDLIKKVNEWYNNEIAALDAQREPLELMEEPDELALDELDKKYEEAANRREKFIEEMNAYGDDLEEFDGLIEDIKDISELLDNLEFEANLEMFDLNKRDVEELAEAYKKLWENAEGAQKALAGDKEALNDSAMRVTRLNRGVLDLSESYEDGIRVLEDFKMDGLDPIFKSLQFQTDACKNLRKSLADVLGVTEDFISVDFLSAIDLETFEKVALGDEEAIESLREQMIRFTLEAELGAEGVNELITYLAQLEDGYVINLDNEPLLRSLIESKMAAGASAAEIEQLLSALGIDADVEPILGDFATVVEAARQAGEDVTGYLSYSTEVENLTQENKDQGSYVTFSESFDPVQVPVSTETLESTDEEGNTAAKPLKYTVTGVKKSVHENVIPASSGTNVTTATSMKVSNEAGQSGVSGIKIKNAHKTTANRVSPITKKYATQNVFEANSGGGGGSGGSGGSKFKPTPTKEKKDTEDRYHELNETLTSLDHVIGQISTSKDSAWGKDKIDLINQETEALSKQTDVYGDLLDAIETKSEEDMGLLNDYLPKALGSGYAGIAVSDIVKIDEYGKVGNYNELVELARQHYNDTIADIDSRKQAAESGSEGAEVSADFDQEYEDAENNFNNFVELLDQIDENANLWFENYQGRMDKIANIQANNMEVLSLKMEMTDLFSNNELEQIEYFLDKTADQFEKRAEALGYYGQRIDVYNKNVQSTFGIIEDLQKLYNSNQISAADFYNELNNQYSQMFDNLDNLIEVQEELKEYYLDTINEGMEEIDIQINKIDHLVKSLDHYKSIVKLTSGEQDYQTFNKIIQAQEKTINNQLEIAKSYVSAFKNQEAELEKQLAIARANGDQETIKKLENDLNEVQNLIVEKETEIANAIVSLGEIAKEELKNTLAEAKNEMEKSILGKDSDYSSIDLLIESMNRLKDSQSEYLTTTNKIYQTNKLINQAEQEIEKTSNHRAKQQYADYIKYIQQLQTSSNLTQFELSMAQADYEILLKKIALEEARDAKNQVRLTRDANGNYGYVYTANQDNIAKAQQEYEDAQNQKYNSALQGAQKYQDQYYQLIKELESALSALDEKRLSGLVNEEEYEKLRAEIVETYLNKAELAYELYTQATGEMMETSSEQLLDYSLMGIDNIEDLEEAVATYTSDSEKAFDNYDRKIQLVAEHNVESFGDIETGIENVTTESQKLTDNITQVLIPTFEQVLASTLAESVLKWDAVTASIKSTREQLELYIKTINTQLNAGSTGNFGDNSQFDFLGGSVGVTASGKTAVVNSGANLSNDIKTPQVSVPGVNSSVIEELPYFEDYAAEIANEISKGEDASWTYIKRLADARDKKVGYTDNVNYAQLMNDYLAQEGHSADDAMYKAYEYLRNHKLEMWENTDYDKMLADHLRNDGAYDDERAQQILEARSQKMQYSDAGTDMISNEELIESLKASEQYQWLLTNIRELTEYGEEQEGTSYAVGDIVGLNPTTISSSDGFTTALSPAYIQTYDGTRYWNHIGAWALDNPSMITKIIESDQGVWYEIDKNYIVDETWLNYSEPYYLNEFAKNYKKMIAEGGATTLDPYMAVQMAQSWNLIERVTDPNQDVLGKEKLEGWSDTNYGQASLALWLTDSVLNQIEALKRQYFNSAYSQVINGESYIPKLNTGGYTGAWGPEGKLAVLHEKELVLNKQDTENFLSATSILREISQTLDSNALLASLGMINLSAMTVGTPADQILQQEVTIHADFPNVTEHNEIEIAIDNLINAASQHAYKI